MGMDLEKTLEFVREELSKQARLAMGRWNAVGSIAFKNKRDFVTKVDEEIEGNLVSAIQSRFPDHGIWGEESDPTAPGAEYQWLVDPIDGTKWYAARSSMFAISVALLFRKTPVLGVVHEPASDQAFYASKGNGAFVNGDLLTGPAPRHLESVIANVDVPRSHALSDEERHWFEIKLVNITRSIYRVRSLGLGSLSACWLASGALDAYLDITGYVKPQDLAAGRIVMKEAGAKVDYVNPTVGPPRLLAALPPVWEKLASILEE
ncbi:MAG: inositol monophosphatase family protein [Myxococcota bacterium]|nr:inositol monophosphatase family protein [Myxococcota bacterium]